jgi:hypothetical protein
MAGRAITVVILALLLAALVVRNAFIDAFAERDPAKAAAVWPGHPSVILALGLTEVGVSTASAHPVNPAIVRRMLATSTKAPLAPEPFLVRGVEAQVEGDTQLALQWFLEARRRDPRSIAARYFLADHYLKTGQTQLGLAEISALTRLVPTSLGGIAPQLAAFARMAGGAMQVRLLLRDQPQLEPWLLNELAANPNDASLILSLWSGRTNNQDRAWQQRLVNSLVMANRFEEAQMAWSRFDPSARPIGELVDPKFEGNAMPPFGWTFASGPAGVAEPDGGGRLQILYYGRDDLVLASQVLLLKPGPYRLAMRVSGVSPSAKSLSWVVSCMPTSRKLTSIGLAAAKGGVLTADFSIPPQGCAAQQLALLGAALELPEQVDIAIAELRLSRGSQ